MGLGGLHINVAQMLKEPSGSVRTYDVAESASLSSETRRSWKVPQARSCSTAGRTRSVVPSSCSGWVDGLWVTATLESNSPFTCSLCLEEYTQPLESASSLTFSRVCGHVVVAGFLPLFP